MSQLIRIAWIKNLTVENRRVCLDTGGRELKIIHGFNIGTRREALLLSESENNILCIIPVRDVCKKS